MNNEKNFFQGSRTSCCINWYDHRPLYVSFLLFLFFVVYLIPLIILFTANTITLIGLKRMREKIKNGIQTVLNRKRIEMEQRILKSQFSIITFCSIHSFISGIIITTCGFIFTWTPYAVTLFASAFRGKDYAVPPLATFFCACFAKSSVIWIPMLYIGTSTQFKFYFVNQNALEQAIGTNRIDATVANGTILQKNKEEIRMGSVPLSAEEK